MKNFLLIDDESVRINSYIQLFNFVCIQHALDGSKISPSYLDQFDGFFLDVMYDSEEAQTNHYCELTFEYVIQCIPDNKPIFIVSGRWEDVMRGNMLTLVRSGKYKNVLGYFSWESIRDDKNELYRDFAKTQLLNFENKNIFNEYDQDEDIVILHISDLEFGNPDQTELLKTQKTLMISQIRRELAILNSKKSQVDIIVISGDITHTGAKEQFQKAKDWIKDLCNQVLKGSIQESVILVPGNHDFHINSTMGNYYEFNFSKKKILKLEKTTNNYSDLGLHNFANFVYELTGDSVLLLNPSEPVINRYYSSAGLNFIQINPVHYEPEQKKFIYKLDDTYMSRILELVNNQSENCINIIISHISPNVINVNDLSSGAASNEIEKLVKDVNAKMWLFGHAHSNSYIDEFPFGEQKIIISLANTLLINNKGRCEAAPNGYTLMNIQRNNNKIIGVQHLKGNQIETLTNVFEKVPSMV